MKGIIEFVKTTIIGGLLVIVPVTILVLVLDNLLSMLIDLAGTATEKTPYEVLTQTGVVVAIAVVAAVGICFFMGLLLRTGPGEALRAWIETNVAERIPLYATLRSLTQRFVGIDGTQFTPAEIDLHGSPARMLGIIVESLPRDRYTVFVPDAPLATVGQIYILPRENVRPLEAPLADVLNSVAQWGLGSARFFRE